jgi:hypothetical protein
MKRRFQGLHQADLSAGSHFPEGTFLMRVQTSRYRWSARKPFYSLSFAVLEPSEHSGKVLTERP